MKKLLLSALSVLAFGATNVDAQVAKTPFIEHFTQASCGPCASQNPTMYNTLNTFAAGGGEYVKLTSQTSWPGVDPMNAEYAAGPAARVAYYGVSGVPDCSLNGGATEGPTTAVTAAKLATKAAEMTPYSIAVSHTWGSAGELIVNVDITNTTVDPVSTHDKLYIAMVEDQISFPTAPGSNGETDFYYVMRQFYDASGAATNGGISLGAIAGNATTSYTFTLTSLPSYIRDLNQISFVSFVQNDSSKDVAQAAKSIPGNVPGLLDVASASNSTIASGYCDLAFTPSVNFTNNGSTDVTTVTAEYTVNGGTAVSQTYSTAPISMGQTVAIDFPAGSLAPGTSIVQYSITDVNSGGLFSNGPNNMAPEVIGKLNTTSVPAPMSEGMESAPLITGEGYSRTLSTAIFDAGDITVGNFAIVDGPTVGEGTIGGFGWSNRSILFNYYNLQSGTMSLVLHKLNLEANSALIFNTAYCQYSGENDKLEVEVSTNCGTSWNSVFMESGTTLAHGLAAQSDFYIPNTSGSGWYEHTVDLSDYDNTNDVIVRFKGTSAYGNNLWLDNIYIASEIVTSVDDVTKNASNVQIMPNPVKDNMTLNFTSTSKNARISIINIQGQIVKEIANNTVIGNNSVFITTADLSAGIYTLSIVSNSDAITKRFVVSK